MAGLTGHLDRGGVDPHRRVRREPERLGLALVGLRERLVHRVRRIDREARHVGAVSLELARGVNSVGSHHDGVLRRAGTVRLELIGERLRLGCLLPRDVDELRIARDRRDQRREVVDVLGDVVASSVDAELLQVCLHLIGESLAVRLLVVDDVDVRLLQVLVDEVRYRIALLAVVRHRAIEEALRRLTGRAALCPREGDARRRARYVGQTCSLVDGSRVLNLLAAGGAGHREDLAVRGERVRHRDVRSGIRRQLRITLHELDLQLVAAVPPFQSGLGPVVLERAEKGDSSRRGIRDADTDLGAALDTPRSRRGNLRRLGGAPRGGRNDNRDQGREYGEYSNLLQHSMPSLWDVLIF